MKKTFLLLVSLLTLSSCINSPFLNHADADTTRIEKQADANCPLAFPKSGLCASLTWETMPTDSDFGSFFLRFWDSKLGTESGPYLTPQKTVFTKLLMPAMGHGSSPVTTSSVLDSGNLPIPGVFRGTGVFFSMPGHWEVWIQLRDGTTVLEQAKIDITI